MKRILSLFLVSVLLLSFLSSCSAFEDESVITINESTDIDTEIFSYFLNEAYYSAESMSEDMCIEAATSESLEYAAVNTQFARLGRSLSANEKAAVSKETNALWRMYGDYLTEIGISKNTFFKIKQYEYYKKDLCFALYDTNGTNPINEDYIKQYFTTNYVGIKYFYEELYTVISPEQYAALSSTDKAAYDASKKAAEERYDSISAIANYVNSGVYNMDEAFMSVTGQVSADISVSAAVVGRNDSSFSKEFIEAVFKQAVGSAFIITNADKSYMYFVERVDLLSDEYGFYDEYRDLCLMAVSESFFVSEISSWIQSYKAVRHLSEAKRCFDRITGIDRSKYIGTQDYQFMSFSPKNTEDIK